MSGFKIGPGAADKLQARLKSDAEEFGYHLNPDDSFTRSLVEGLLTNIARYGIWLAHAAWRLETGTKIWTLSVHAITEIPISANMELVFVPCTSTSRY